MSKHPETRPTATLALEHPWVANAFTPIEIRLPDTPKSPRTDSTGTGSRSRYVSPNKECGFGEYAQFAIDRIAERSEQEFCTEEILESPIAHVSIEMLLNCGGKVTKTVVGIIIV
jgi:hypothetical protein